MHGCSQIQLTADCVDYICNCLGLIFHIQGTPKMGTLANIEDPDEMLQNTAIHQGLYSLPRYKAIFRK